MLLGCVDSSLRQYFLVFVDMRGRAAGFINTGTIRVLFTDGSNEWPLSQTSLKVMDEADGKSGLRSVEGPIPLGSHLLSCSHRLWRLHHGWQSGVTLT